MAGTSAPRILKTVKDNLILIWVDANIHRSNSHSQQTLRELGNVVHEVKSFTDANTCIQFLKKTTIEQVIVITSGSIGQGLVPQINQLVCVHSIYILCSNRTLHEQWVKQWVKIKGVHTDVKSVCAALQSTNKEDVDPISLVQAQDNGAAIDLNQLEPSFMYTEIFKKVLLDMKHDTRALGIFVSFARKRFSNRPEQLNLIDEFYDNYQPDKAIFWYTRQCFLHKMLNHALISLDGETIINMGFYVHDLHRQLEQFHKSPTNILAAAPFTVFRGTSLPISTFDKLQSSPGGLIAFNHFLSTSQVESVSLEFAQDALEASGDIGILFTMRIDPKLSSIPFANISEISSFAGEKEILFSMHTVFRILSVQQMSGENGIYKVELNLTGDDDSQLSALTKQIEQEIQGDTPWERLGSMLIRVGQFNEAEKHYQSLLIGNSEQKEISNYHHQLGMVKNRQGDHQEAIKCYQKAIEIRQKILPPDHPELARSYNNIGEVYNGMRDYTEALRYYIKAVDIRRKSLAADHLDRAESYNNVGAAQFCLGHYDEALSNYKRALEIWRKTLPANHPELATCYNNIGLAYQTLGDCRRAMHYYQKDLEICKNTLPTTHPDLATAYSNVGRMMNEIGEYSRALSFFERALNIREVALPPTHPSLILIRQLTDDARQKATENSEHF